MDIDDLVDFEELLHSADLVSAYSRSGVLLPVDFTEQLERLKVITGKIIKNERSKPAQCKDCSCIVDSYSIYRCSVCTNNVCRSCVASIKSPFGPCLCKECEDGSLKCFSCGENRIFVHALNVQVILLIVITNFVWNA